MIAARRRYAGLRRAAWRRGAGVLLLGLLGARAAAEPIAPPVDCAASYGDASRPATICIRRAATRAERPARDHDICAAIAHFAAREGLPPDFFARLIWRESLFEPNAVSPAGAQGVAQFMPSTARLRGLSDSFNPAEALGASAAYLAELRARYGNLGLAAAAYNAGEGAINGVVAGRRSAPLETEAYVRAITGLALDEWLDGAARPQIDYRLSQGAEASATPFHAACLALASTRRVAPLAPQGDWKPWGALIAANHRRAAAERMYRSAERRYGRVFPDAEPLILRRRLPGRGRRPLHAAMVGFESRAEAATFCRRLSSAGGACVVIRN